MCLYVFGLWSVLVFLQTRVSFSGKREMNIAFYSLWFQGRGRCL